MKNKKLSLDNLIETVCSYSKYQNNLFDEPDVKHKKMLNLLKKIIHGELTHKQKTCILLYYEKKLKMKEISEKLNISVSSVSKHIKKGLVHIKKNMNYYF